MKNLTAEYDTHEKAYRVYDRRHPQQTIAYDEDIVSISDWAFAHGYSGVSVKDGPMCYIIKQS